MSYIRCTSNPEGLYSWSDIDGNVYFSIDEKILDIRHELFDSFFKQFLENKYLASCLPCAYDNDEEQPLRMERNGQYISVRECWVDEDTNQRITQDTIREYEEEWANRNYEGSIRRYGSRVELNINGNPIYLYDVTWEYLVNNIVDSLRHTTLLGRIRWGLRFQVYWTIRDLIIGIFK